MFVSKGFAKQTLTATLCAFDHDHTFAPQDTCRRGGCIRLETRSRCVPLNSCVSDRFRCHTAAEFNNAGCLLISEVKYLLENRDKDAPDTAYVVRGQFLILFYPPILGYSVYNKTLEYVKTFAKFSTTDSASAVRE